MLFAKLVFSLQCFKQFHFECSEFTVRTLWLWNGSVRQQWVEMWTVFSVALCELFFTHRVPKVHRSRQFPFEQWNFSLWVVYSGRMHKLHFSPSMCSVRWIQRFLPQRVCGSVPNVCSRKLSRVFCSHSVWDMRREQRFRSLQHRSQHLWRVQRKLSVWWLPFPMERNSMFVSLWRWTAPFGRTVRWQQHWRWRRLCEWLHNRTIPCLLWRTQWLHSCSLHHLWVGGSEERRMQRTHCDTPHHWL